MFCASISLERNKIPILFILHILLLKATCFNWKKPKSCCSLWGDWIINGNCLYCWNILLLCATHLQMLFWRARFFRLEKSGHESKLSQWDERKILIKLKKHPKNNQSNLKWLEIVGVDIIKHCDKIICLAEFPLKKRQSQRQNKWNSEKRGMHLKVNG